MNYSRVLLVPFTPTSLLLVAIFSVLLTFLGGGSLVVTSVLGIIGTLFLQIWMLKYCYVLVEHIADGAIEPPVMSTDMLSSFESRPLVQLAIVGLGGWACYLLGGTAGVVLGIVLLLLLPASIAVLGIGEPVYQAINPVTLLRLIRGLGPYYLAILASILVYAILLTVLSRLHVWGLFRQAAALLCEISFFSLIGGCLYQRRKQIGFEPSRSPERTAAREERDRLKLRAKMLDDVFQNVRAGKHVDATRPLARWLGELDEDLVVRDALFVAEQAARWDYTASLNTIASTLIRHLLRAGRADAALNVFELLRARSTSLTLDSAPDLRTLIEYAESSGRTELARTMRLETPVFQPRT
jgi:pentatricopeptide repeat protein